MALGAGQNALYQNNDQCVKSGLTTMYWGNGQFAQISLIMAAIIGLFTI